MFRIIFYYSFKLTEIAYINAYFKAFKCITTIVGRIMTLGGNNILLRPCNLKT